MTASAAAEAAPRTASLAAGYPAASRAMDWTATLIGGWVIGGLYLDGWAHNHGRVDDVFFTPWHAVLYSGVLVNMVYLALVMGRNLRRGYPWRRALPVGYLVSLVGAGIFAVGGVLDMLWHLAFGVEVDVEALLSPTHLLLAVGGVLMVTGPVRAAWARHAHSRGWLALGPLLLSATLFLGVLTFFTSVIHPLVYTLAAVDPTLRRPNNELYLMRADGTRQTRLTISGEGLSDYAAWSPDGMQIVYSAGQAADRDLVIMAADGAPESRRTLTHGASSDWAPAWSPDGQQIAFASDRDGPQALFVVAAQGGEPRRLISGSGRLEAAPAWSPDGRRVAFCGSANGFAGNWQLYVVNADGSGLARLTEGDGCYPSWSPDGREVVYHTCANGNDCDLHILAVDDVLAGTAQPRPLTSGPAFDWRPSWSPDGRQVLFTSDRAGGTLEAFVMPAAGGEPANLTQNPALYTWQAAWSPDGQSVVTSASGNDPQPDWLAHALGAGAVLLQAVLLMLVALPLARRFSLPFGALTVLIGGNSLMVAVFADTYGLAAFGVAAGLLADLLYRWLRPPTAPPARFYAFAFGIPVLVFGLHFLGLALGPGLAWTIHLWLGVTVMAGLMGLMLAVGNLSFTPLRTDVT
jgi:Tol biopolymer transport system component